MRAHPGTTSSHRAEDRTLGTCSSVETTVVLSVDKSLKQQWSWPKSPSGYSVLEPTQAGRISSRGLNMRADTKRKLGLGILSAAHIAKKNVRGILQNKKGLEVVAVASRSLSKAEAFIRDTGIEGKAKPYGSYEQLLADPQVQAVYIPLPAGLRPYWVKKAAQAGKHVLSEKPIALTAKETDEVIDACRKAGVQYMDGTMWLHNPRRHYMQEILRNEKLVGPLQIVISAFSYAAPEEFMKGDVRVQKDLDGLGCLGDIGWYCLSNTLWAYNHDPPSRVQAQLGPKFNDNNVLTHVAGTVVWEDGRRAMFDCGFDTAMTQLIQVSGTKGLLLWHDFCIPQQEGQCEFVHKGDGRLADVYTRVEQPIEEKKVYLDRPQETHMWETFAQCIYDIQDGKPPNDYWPRISALTNKVVVAVQESAENDCKVIQFKL